MFDCTRSPDTPPNNNCLVKIVLDDGTALDAHVCLPASTTLTGLINGADPFLDITAVDGTQRLVNKNNIRSLSPAAVPSSDQLRRARSGSFDPYRALGLSQNAGLDAVKRAYHIRARLYHPDRFAGIDLAPEMAAYTRAMLRRIDMAYDMLMDPESA